MKKIILGLLVGMLIMSCSNDSKIKSGITEYLDKNAKDPKSYELVELTDIKPLILGEVAKSCIDKYKNTITEETKNKSIAEETLKMALDSQKKYGSDFDIDVKQSKSSIENCQWSIDGAKKDIENYSKVVNSKDIIGYKAHHKYRLKNGFGALDLAENDVLFDKDYKVIDFEATSNNGEFLLRQATKK